MNSTMHHITSNISMTAGVDPPLPTYGDGVVTIATYSPTRRPESAVYPCHTEPNVSPAQQTRRHVVQIGYSPLKATKPKSILQSN